MPRSGSYDYTLLFHDEMPEAPTRDTESRLVTGFRYHAITWAAGDSLAGSPAPRVGLRCGDGCRRASTAGAAAAAGPAEGFVLHLPVTTTCKPVRAAVAANHCRAITRRLTGCGGQQRVHPG